MAISEDILAMTFTETALSIDGMLIDSATISNVLREAKRRPNVVEVTLRTVSIDDTVTSGIQELFDSTLEREWSKLEIIHCTGDVASVLAAATTVEEPSDDGADNNINNNNNNNNNYLSKTSPSNSPQKVKSIQQIFFTGSVPIAHNPRYSLDVASLQVLRDAIQFRCPSLTTLCLKGTRLLRDGLQSLGDGLAHAKHLRTFRMSHCAMEATDIPLLASALAENKQLTVLLLAHCKVVLTTAMVEPSATTNTTNSTHENGGEIYGTTHTHLNDSQEPLSSGTNVGNGSSEDPWNYFALLLESLVGHPTLECLNVFGMVCTARACQALSDMLTSPTTKVWHLGLKNNLATPEDKLPIVPVIQALQTNTTLTSLQISGNNVDDADVEFLAQVLCQNSTLRGLGLTANNISSVGVMSMAQRLSDMNGLRYLDLQRNNQIKAAAKQAMIAGLVNNSELERLDLDGTFHETKSYYTSLNKGGRRLLQISNAPLALWPLVLARANRLSFGRNQPFANINVLYCLVRGPALFQRPGASTTSPQEELRSTTMMTTTTTTTNDDDPTYMRKRKRVDDGKDEDGDEPMEEPAPEKKFK